MQTTTTCPALPTTVYALGSTPWFAPRCVTHSQSDVMRDGMHVSERLLWLVHYDCATTRSGWRGLHLADWPPAGAVS